MRFRWCWARYNFSFYLQVPLSAELWVHGYDVFLTMLTAFQCFETTLGKWKLKRTLMHWKFVIQFWCRWYFCAHRICSFHLGWFHFVIGLNSRPNWLLCLDSHSLLVIIGCYKCVLVAFLFDNTLSIFTAMLIRIWNDACSLALYAIVCSLHKAVYPIWFGKDIGKSLWMLTCQTAKPKKPRNMDFVS